MRAMKPAQSKSASACDRQTDTAVVSTVFCSSVMLQKNKMTSGGNWIGGVNV